MRESRKELLRELEDSKGQEVYEDLLSLREGLRMTEVNMDELSECVDSFDLENDIEPGDVPEFVSEVQVRLHNYVASTYSVYSNVCTMKERHGDRIDTEEYRKRTESFGERSDFLQRLRAYMQKYRLPRIRTEHDITVAARSQKPNAKVFIHMEDLRSWDGWTSNAQERLESIGDEDEVNIVQELEEYHNIFVDFNRWFINELRESHRSEIQERNEIVEALRNTI
jgi:hypothetical protein